MRGAMPPLAHYTSTAWCLVKAHGQLYLYLCAFLNEGQNLGLNSLLKKIYF